MADTAPDSPTPDSPAPDSPIPEWSVPITLAEARIASAPIAIAADARARAALAKRCDVDAIDALSAKIMLTVVGTAISLTGSFTANVAQRCVASDQPVATAIAEPIDLRFVPAAELDAADVAIDAEADLDADACDDLPYDGHAIDLGEVVAQSLALAINPYPRHPDADAYLRAHGVVQAQEAGAFGALAGLLGALKK